jgi:hypothetical protein
MGKLVIGQMKTGGTFLFIALRLPNYQFTHLPNSAC